MKKLIILFCLFSFPALAAGTYSGGSGISNTTPTVLANNSVIGTPGFSATSGTTPFQITGSINNYFQLSIQNLSSGSSSSSDFVPTANDGSDSTHYADFGINNSNGGAQAFTNAHAAYMYSTDTEFDIGALGSGALTSLYAGGGTSTPTQVLKAAATQVCALGMTCEIGVLKTANFNAVTDQSITMFLPSGATKYRITDIFVTNCSANLVAAAGGFYTAASKGGTIIGAITTTYTGCTSAGTTVADNISLTNMVGNVFSASTLYLSLTTAQGTAATGDVYIIGIPIN